MNRSKTAGALALALALAACATAPAPRHTGRAPALDRQARTDAQAFETFMRKAAAIDASFSGPAEVGRGLVTGAAYEPRQLEAGMIAYAAMAALEEPGFVSGVRKAARARRGNDLAVRLAARPDLADDLPGGTAAAARAGAALQHLGAPLAAGGRQVKAAAYSIQRKAWSKIKVADPQGRLTRVKQIGATRYRPEGADRASLYRAVSQVGGRNGAAGPVVQRGIALAALTILGQPERGLAFASEPKSALCLRLAKLDFHQCLASAGPYYEDIYCLGQHAMIDPGQCVITAAR